MRYKLHVGMGLLERHGENFISKCLTDIVNALKIKYDFLKTFETCNQSFFACEREINLSSSLASRTGTTVLLKA